MRPIHLRMARAALKWTVRELAARSGVNKNTVARYEAEKEILTGSLVHIQDVLLEQGVRFIESDDEMGPGVRVVLEFGDTVGRGGEKTDKKRPLRANLKKRSQKKT